MNHSVTAIVVTGLLSVGAGAVIAGLPSDPPGGDLVIIEPVPTTTTSTTSAPTTPMTSVGDPDDGAPTTTTSTLDPVPDASAPSTDATLAGERGDPAGSPGDGAVDPILADIPRGELVVAAANAGGVGGLAAATAAGLAPFGYEVQPVDAVGLSDTSTVYFADGLAAEAGRLAADLGWTIGDIAPMITMPPLRTGRIYQLVAVIGVDRA